MSEPRLHKTQMSILHMLRYTESERFSALMHPTGHTSDTFKFHLRKLVQLGYVAKTENGEYQLTAQGKEYANNLNETVRATEKQPKLSALCVVSRTSSDGRVRYLLQKRARQPFYGYWSEIHGRVMWGELFEETAQRQLKRQTGLDATFTVCGFRRVRDYDVEGRELLEDKLFVILRASKVTGEPSHNYDGGTNAWLSLDELRAQEKLFPSTLAIIDELESGTLYTAQEFKHEPKDY